MDLGELARLMRAPAVRAFDGERSVPDGVVSAIVDAARWTGSARNRQPWLIVRVRSGELLREISQLGAYAGFVRDAPVLLVVASADDGFSDTLFDCGRLVQSLLLAAAAEGLRGCPATVFPDANVKRVAELLGLETGWLPRHLVALGHPAQRRSAPGRSAVPRGRKELAQIYRDRS